MAGIRDGHPKKMVGKIGEDDREWYGIYVAGRSGEDGRIMEHTGKKITKKWPEEVEKMTGICLTQFCRLNDDINTKIW